MQKQVEDLTRQGGGVDMPGIVQGIWPYHQMVYAQTGIRPGEWDAKFFWDFVIQTEQLIPARRPDLTLVGKENEPAY